MNEIVKKKWVKALRSGEYKKGQYQLKTNQSNGKDTYCCLGVLTDLYIKETKHKGGWDGKNGFERFAASLPPKVTKWAGLKVDDPVVPFKVSRDSETLSYINDHTNKGFKSIATLIEKHL